MIDDQIDERRPTYYILRHVCKHIILRHFAESTRSEALISQDEVSGAISKQQSQKLELVQRSAAKFRSILSASSCEYSEEMVQSRIANQITNFHC